MNFLVPRDMLLWLDQNRGPMSRQAFIIHCVYKIMEIDQIKDQILRK